jgi:phosphatidylglycerophosphate synthase
MLSYKKSQIETHLEPLARLFSKVNPNVLTLIGSIPPLLFFVFVIYKMYFLAFFALLGSAVDLLDGMVARKYNKVTNFGGFFDSIIDRVGDFLYITAFSFSGIVRWEIAAPLLLFSFMTSYIRSRAGLAANSHMEFAVGLIERPERLIFIFLSLLLFTIFPEVSLNGLNLAELAFLLLTFLSFVTVIQRTIHAYKKL